MKRATITIPDDLESRIKEYTRNQEAPPSLNAVVQAALEEYLDSHERSSARWLLDITPIEEKDDAGEPDVSVNHDSYHDESAAVDLPKPLLFEEMTQEELDRVPRVLKITPAETGSGFSDVSINHDKYLADLTYERKLPPR